ncbi:MAG: hypothetical protein M3512_18530 [Bacteroidota bacterium]|nr:hypothetical protein [Bacteroidota bacterium]
MVEPYLSEHERISLEKRFIALKIERVKELLDYNELNLSQIADLLGYSSVNYFPLNSKR